MDEFGRSSGGSFSYLIASTKSKLFVLSSLLGVGAIYYMTKNYLQNGRFFPSWYVTGNTEEQIAQTTNLKKNTVIGGKGHIVIKEEIDSSGSPKTMKIHRQRSRKCSVSSRRSVLSTKSNRSKVKIIQGQEKMDMNLNKAIIDLDNSMTEVESILDLKNEYNRASSNNQIIEHEIERLRKLLDYAQDFKLVQRKAGEYLHKQIQTSHIEDDLHEICNVNELDNPVNYEEDMQSIYTNQFGDEDDDDYDSDNDSFASAAESVDLEITEDEVQDYVTFQKKLKDMITKYSKEDFLMYGIEYLTNYGVPIRTVRTDLVNCDNDVDYSVKVFCLRRAFKHLLKSSERKDWFVKTGKEMLTSLLRKSGYDHLQFSVDYDEMVRFCEDTANWGFIDEELSRRGVCYMNFYDIVLDFMIMDSLEDLENPPSTVTSAIQNRWLSDRIKQTALSTAIWTVIKAKKRRLTNPDGFFSRFYDISTHLTPLLAWGFLGPVEELNKMCSTFKGNIIGFMKDIFSTEKVDYKSVQTLSEDIFRIANLRKEELLAAIG